MSSDFVTPGFVDAGYVSEDLLISGYSNFFANIHATDFREVRRGRYPLDWTQRWVSAGTLARVEGAAEDHHGRNVFQPLSSATTGKRCLHTWNAPDNDSGRGDQETLTLGRIAVNGDEALYSLRLHLRASGVGELYNSYQLLVGTNSHLLRKLINGVATDLGTITKPLGFGTFIYCRFRAQGTSIRIKLWQYGDVEPASWDTINLTLGGTSTSVTDSTHIDGWNGIEGFWTTTTTEISFYSCATNGGTAPNEDYIGQPLDQWIKNNDLSLEMTAKVEMYDILTDSVVSEWVSTHGRITGPTDYPPNTTIRALLKPSGIISSYLQGDIHLKTDAGNLSQLEFYNERPNANEPGPLDHWRNFDFGGRPVEIRLGKRWLVRPGTFDHTTGSINYDGILNPHRRFEIIQSPIADHEPAIRTDRVTINVLPADKALDKQIQVKRNVGINTGVKMVTSTGYVSIPSSTSYDITSWAIYIHAFPLSVAGGGNGWFSRRVTGAFYQWSIAYGYASHPTVGNRLFVQVDAADNTTLFSYTHPTLLNDNQYHDIILALNNLDRWYLILDGERVAYGEGLTKQCKIATGQVVEAGRVLPGVSLFDHRIEKYVNEDEAISRFSSRREPDGKTISMHRMNDNSGAVVTDFAPLANHGNLVGTITTDYIWTPTYKGSAELSGVSMPFSGGVLFHAPTQPIDPLRSIYRYNDKVVTNGSQIEARIKGSIITNPTDYTEPATGVIDIVTSADQPVTYATKPTLTPSPDLHIPHLVRDELISRQSLDSTTMDSDSFLALSNILPVQGGFHYAEPPTVRKFLSDQLTPLSANYHLDRDGRVAAGIVLPPINPGPFGFQSFLEFLGYPGRGVTIANQTSYNLTVPLSVTFAFYLTAPIIPDLSTSSAFTYHPKGQALIDKTVPTSTGSIEQSGLYIGFDGRDGGLIFSTPGVTSGSGLHYRKIGNHTFWEPGRWHVVVATINNNMDRALSVRYMNRTNTAVVDIGDSYPSADIACSGTFTNNTAPIRVGCGPSGSFSNGCVAWVYGCSPSQGEPLLQGDPITDGILNDIGGPDELRNGAAVIKWNIPLQDGDGDLALETVAGKYGRVEGARWAPRLTLDFDSVVEPMVDVYKRLRPLWSSDVKYRKNYSRLSQSDMVAGVSAADRIALSEESLSDPYRDPKTRRDNFLSAEYNLESSLYIQANTQAISRLLRLRFTRDRRIGTIRNWFSEVLRLGLMDEVVFYHDRWEGRGRALRVGWLSVNLESLLGDLSMWG